MNSSDEAPARGVKRFAIILTAFAVLAGAVAAYQLFFRAPADGPTAVTAAASEIDAKRYDYQQRLNGSPHRFDPGLNMIVFSGRAYIRTDQELETMTGHCTVRCGTVEKWVGTFAVRLPVGYVHGTNVVPDPGSWEPVDMLTFWDQPRHQLDTVRDSTVDDRGVRVPKSLLEYRKAADLRPGETAYTTADFIRDGCDGKTYMIDMLLGYEPLGDKYGYTFDTAVTLEDDGTFAVKLPDGRKPLPCRGSFNRDNTVLVVVQ